jgi:hypothetical protein
MPRLQLRIRPAASPIDGVINVSLNRDIHTRRVILEGYSLHQVGANAAADQDRCINIDIPWLSSAYHTDQVLGVNTDPSGHLLRLPLTNFADRSGAQFGMNMPFDVVSAIIPQNFTVRCVGDSGGFGYGRFASGGPNTFDLTLYFTFDDRIMGV